MTHGKLARLHAGQTSILDAPTCTVIVNRPLEDKTMATLTILDARLSVANLRADLYTRIAETRAKLEACGARNSRVKSRLEGKLEGLKHALQAVSLAERDLYPRILASVLLPEPDAPRTDKTLD